MGLIESVLDPAGLVIILAVVGAFLTIIAFALPYLKPDPMAARVRGTAQRRQELRQAQLDGLQRRSRLRRDQPNRLKEIAERFKLRELFAGKELRNQLLQANWRGPNALTSFVIARALSPMAMGALSVLFLFGMEFEMEPSTKLIVCFGAVVLGVYLPNLLMTSAIQKRQQAFTQAFPDALDLLLICVESGLSVEVAFGRVAQEIGEQSPELAEELELTTAELAYLPERRLALENLVHRTGLASVKAVCTTLIQADKYGTPLTAALRTAAQENRDRRMAAAEKKAGSLPAKLTVPMIAFFLPVLFVVILGPAIIQMSMR